MLLSALLKASDDSYFWYQRAHHIVYDGYGGGLVAWRLAELYTAYARGMEPEPNCFCTVEATLEACPNWRLVFYRRCCPASERLTR